MKKESLWELFVKTGHPMWYMLHKREQEEDKWKE